MRFDGFRNILIKTIGSKRNKNEANYERECEQLRSRDSKCKVE